MTCESTIHHILNIDHLVWSRQLKQSASITRIGGYEIKMSDEDLQEQLDTLLLLQSMYPLDNELTLETETEAILNDPELLRETTKELVAWLTLPLIQSFDGQTSNHDTTLVETEFWKRAGSVQIKVVLPLASTISNSKQPLLSIQSLPQDFNRSECQQVVQTVDKAVTTSGQDTNDIASEQINDYAQLVVETARDLAWKKYQASAVTTATLTSHDPEEPLERVYFWFPSLSTPAKRKDLVNYASRYNLTGFVLAGKPGLLCLEGKSQDFGHYMNDIKNESWGDIPSYQKKASQMVKSSHYSF